ncbi:TIGR03857 family LLM class F420-dependent oxidoreductase [Mycobacterium sp. E1747]|uniref:TIGR03857 family LLM class F420-dependent oxidoreductase n=1 Tax=Mycobacterium sp. E1747 TaxID=1834128 RepID=UPI00080220F3|nr:TIGR03857 family LLM class F420-dependent oxidoreductase [Mycobacterium sp. E1747]OBH11155.1 LLM class F420-dependent oxidoreductase [Mycobacterium sp. E1747]
MVDSCATEQAANAAPVIDDLSIFLTAGRQRHPGVILEDGRLAETLGLHRGFLSERYDIKVTGPLLGGVGAVTSRLSLGTGVLAAGARHPVMTAALGATMQAAYGERTVLGLGRGHTTWMETLGLANQPGALGKMYSLRAFVDYIDIIRRLWRGETVDYDGPAGRYEGIFMADPPQCTPPPIWWGLMGGPKAAKIAATVADGAVMLDLITPEAVARTAEIIRTERERAGLDPAGFRLAVGVITTPDFDEVGVLNQTAARLLTYIVGMPSVVESYAAVNGWDARILHELTEHALFKAQRTKTADLSYRRDQLIEAAKHVPLEWMHDSCAIGSSAEVVTSLQRFRDAGADEVVIYGSTTADNEKVIELWRQRPEAVD